MHMSNFITAHYIIASKHKRIIHASLICLKTKIVQHAVYHSPCCLVTVTTWEKNVHNVGHTAQFHASQCVALNLDVKCIQNTR